MAWLVCQGRRLIAVSPLHRRQPVETPAGSRPRAPLPALGGVDLYSVVDSRCVRVSGPEAPILVRLPLSGGGVHVLARGPAGAVSVVAAGSRLARTYVADSPLHGARVDVVNAVSGQVARRALPSDRVVAPLALDANRLAGAMLS